MLSKRTKICIETDLSIINIKQLFNQKGLKNLGLLLDIGNIKANGYKLEDYINNFPNKIYGIHLKKRNFLFSKSLPITAIALDYLLGLFLSHPNLHTRLKSELMIHLCLVFL